MSIEIRQLPKRNTAQDPDAGQAVPGCQILETGFADFEAAAGFFQDTGWQAEYFQLEPGAFRGSVLATEARSAQVSRCVWGKKIRHRGAQPPGTIALGVTMTQARGAGRFLGMPMGLDDVIVQSGGGDLEIFSAPGWEAVVFVVRESEWPGWDASPEGHGAHARPTVASALPRQSLVRLSPEQGLSLRSACRLYFQLAETWRSEPGYEFPLVRMAEDLTFLATGLVAGAQSPRQPSLPMRRRLELIRRAEDYARRGASESLRVSELCRTLDVSERTLRSAFHDLTRVSPGAYLKSQRLSRAHRDLLEADPSETLVKHVAYQHGFWHLGQFSQDYRRHFMERPSETLAAHTRRPRAVPDLPSLDLVVDDR